MRFSKSVPLGFNQFAVFDALHRVGAREGKRLTANKLADIVYHGSINPSTKNTIHAVVSGANKKLLHIGLRIRGVNRGRNSFYQIVPLEVAA